MHTALNLQETEKKFVLDTTALETPTYILAIVLLVFLVLSFALDNGVDLLKKWLLRKQRPGLAEAADRAVMELTILGFVSIVLLLFRGMIEGICIDYSTTQVHWTLLDDIKGCPCCLADTDGVTTCAQLYHGCAFNDNTGATFCGCESDGTNGTSYYNTTYALPSANTPDALIQITNPFGEAEGGTGTCVPYRETETDFVFNQFDDRVKEVSIQLGANATKICRRILDSNSSSAFAPAPGPLQLRRSLQQEETPIAALPASSSQNGYVAENETLHVVPKIQTFRCEGPFPSGTCPPGQIPAIGPVALDQVHLVVFLMSCLHVAASVFVVLLATLRMEQWKWWQKKYLEEVHAKEALNEEEKPQDVENNTITNGNNDAGVIISGAAVDQIEGSTSLATNGEIEKKSPTPLPAWRRRLNSAAFILGRTLVPVPVSKSSFFTMRSRYINSLGLPVDFDFVRECTLHLDYDLSKIIGASVTLWILLIFIWVIVGVALWIISFLFLFIAVFGTISINILLVATIKSSCDNIPTDGSPGNLSPVTSATRWYSDFRTLATPIGSIIFICSKIFSLTLFLSWQFGSENCFLTSGVTTRVLSSSEWIPYWMLVIVAALILSWLSLVTVPMWQLVMHMRPRDDWIAAAARGERERRSVFNAERSKSERQWESQAEIVAEITRLQSKMRQLQ